MTPAGVREMALYVDNRDLVTDWLAGVIRENEEIVYKNVICVVIGEFTDADGNRYTELLEISGGVSFVGQREAGFVPHHVEFTINV